MREFFHSIFRSLINVEDIYKQLKDLTAESNSQKENIKKLDESIKKMTKNLDRLNDTIADHYEGSDFIGEITEGDIDR